MEVDRAKKYLLKSESIGSILIDKFRRPFYIRFIFIGKCKDAMQLSLVEDLEKLRIPYSGGIVYNPDAIVISMVNYIQLCSIYPEYKKIPSDVKVEQFYLKSDESELIIWDPFVDVYRATSKFIVLDINFNKHNFKIPLINPQLQKEISDRIKESFKLRNESKQLLEQAKKMVEDEIEKE